MAKIFSNLKLEGHEYKDNFDYKVSIIDHNVNFITLLSHQSLIIGENDYRIVNNDNTKNDNTNNDNTNNDNTNNTIYDTNDDPSDSDKSDDFVKLDANQIIYA